MSAPPPELEALWEPLCAVLLAPHAALDPFTRRILTGALRQLARALDRPCPIPTRDERAYVDKSARPC